MHQNKTKTTTKIDKSRSNKFEILMFLVIWGVPGPESGQTNEFLKIPRSYPKEFLQSSGGRMTGSR